MSKPGLFIAMIGAAALSSCAGLPTGTSSDWSCRAISNGGCHSIADNDRALTGLHSEPRIVPAMPGVAQETDRPVFYGPAVLRVSIPAWVDNDGRYHSGSTIFVTANESLWGAPQSETLLAGD